MNHSVGVVLVTYNRLDMLKKALISFDVQTDLPEYILVVNNASSDGTKEFLDGWKTEPSSYKRITIHLEENTGGSGGFYYGLKTAQELYADWIWVSDDDAFPKSNAIQVITNYIKNCNELDSISAVCCSVMNNGVIDTWHRRNIVIENGRIIEKVISAKEYNNDSFELNCFSYVGTVINKEKLMKVGLPEKDYFIFYDDTEHSLRLSKEGRIICLPKAVVHHDLKSNYSEINKWKQYYKIRNRLLTYKKHFSWKAVQKAYYPYAKHILKYSVLKTLGRKTTITYEAVMDSKNNTVGINPRFKPGKDMSEETVW